ncbi:MAG: hypothetical protein ACYS5V_11825 [Planctomycetota bacterium]|jgi:hypothetical protein
MATVRQMLREAVVTHEELDRFLDPHGDNWAMFDPELGYVPHDSRVRDGIDGAASVYRYEAGGQRKMVNYADAPCRINTYGDSFTQCHQVSDGETWQEALAAHFGEPVRNFGVGGYGVYQAFRRMVRVEQTESAARHVVLNIFSDDHYRSIYVWRWLHMPGWVRGLREKGFAPDESYMFHANPWAHVKLDLATGTIVECPNPYPTRESLYQLCDPRHVHEAFRPNVAVQAFLATRGAEDVDTGLLGRAAEVLGVPSDLSSPDAAAETGRAMLWACALKASIAVVEKARGFARDHGRELMILLSYGWGHVEAACEGRERFDGAFLDYLQANGFAFVDTLARHEQDYRLFDCTPRQYVRRYYAGHYNPMGNLFFAFAVKDELVAWLDPAPPAYRAGGGEGRRLAAELA